MQTDPRRVRILDRNGHDRWHALWEGNPRIVRPGEVGDFQSIVNGSSCRPYHTGKTDERWSYNLEFRPTPAELYLTRAEEAFGKRHAGRVIVEPHIKANASPNKRWAWVKWNKLAWLLRERGIVVAQLGVPGTQTLDGADLITTQSFREACAVLKYSRAAVLHEGGLSHAAVAVGLPGVVIFGGFTPIELTGYDCHVNLGASLGDACGMRVPCKHCEMWMEKISPESVLGGLLSLL